MAHELRSPLNVILGYSEELQRDSRIGAGQREKAAMVHRSGEHLLTLIDQVLGMSGRMEPSGFSPEKAVPGHLEDVGPADAHSGHTTFPKVEGLEPGQPEWRILVADDSPENLMLLKGLFSRVGFTVIEAADGVAAVERFEQERPHLIWMDLNMPQLDGYGATAEIRARPGGDAVKILAFTADPTDAEQRHAMHAGCDAVLCKPVRAGELFRAMQQQLGVRYTYQAPDAALPPCGQVPLDLSPEQRRALLEAARRLDVAASEQVLKSLNPRQSQIAERLWPLVRAYRFGRILELLND